jgi:hypothetical protein
VCLTQSVRPPPTFLTLVNRLYSQWYQKWNDPARGKVPLSWALDPNLAGVCACECVSVCMSVYACVFVYV